MTTHIPVIRIETPEPDNLGTTPNILTRLTIDGAEWAVVGYSVDGSSVDRIQRMTLTFLADVTIEHPHRPKP
jgi:hypothetical protein